MGAAELIKTGGDHPLNTHTTPQKKIITSDGHFLFCISSQTTNQECASCPDDCPISFPSIIIVVIMS